MGYSPEEIRRGWRLARLLSLLGIPLAGLILIGGRGEALLILVPLVLAPWGLWWHYHRLLKRAGEGGPSPPEPPVSGRNRPPSRTVAAGLLRVARGCFLNLVMLLGGFLMIGASMAVMATFYRHLPIIAWGNLVLIGMMVFGFLILRAAKAAKDDGRE